MIEKFNNAAIGKFPTKFSFHDGSLTFKKGVKFLTLEVSNNPYEAAPACIEFFHANGGIFSPLDEQNTVELQQARVREVINQDKLTWGNANKKIQENILCYYIDDMKALMKLDNAEGEQLREVINLGIATKHFGKHNINIVGNRVHTIEGLLWNNEARNFYINPSLVPITTRTYDRKSTGQVTVEHSQKDTIPQFGARWNKYLETLDKKIALENRRKVTINREDSGFRYLSIGGTSGETMTSTSDDY